MNDTPRRALIAGNWKMNGTLEQSRRLIEAIVAGLPGQPDSGPEVLVCPPFPHLVAVGQTLRDAGPGMGGQDLSAYDAGAHTGDVSGAMLVDCGATYVLVGHSERRQDHHEDDAGVAAKFDAAQRAGLRPVLCVGETLEQREAGQAEAVIAAQLAAVVDAVGIERLENAVVAYEPVWAIGTGRTASPEQAQRIHAFIRSRLAADDATIAGQIRVVYGGSMKPENAAELLACDDIDGGLIGGASLVADSFLAIVQAATRVQ